MTEQKTFPMAKLAITVSVTQDVWDNMDDRQLDIENEKIAEALDKVSSYALQLLGDKYRVEIEL